MKFLIIILSVCAALISPDMSFAKEIEIKSENFILSGNLKKKDGEGLLRDLEIFRENVFKVLGVNGSSEIIPVKVYVAKNEKALKSLIGVGGFGGMYTMTHNGPAFILNGKNGFRRGEGARHIALHEYTHHIVSTYTELDYPRWYNEGFANFLATFSYKDGTFRVGDPYDLYAYTLRQKNWMPMTIVLGTMEKYPFNIGDTSKVGQQTQAQFYAQTWLAVHYLRNEEKYAGTLSDYVSRLNKGERSLPAFKAAMGVTPEEFEVELKAYYKKNKYNVTVFTTKESDIPAPTMRALSDKEAQMARLTAMRNFVFTPERSEAVIKAYEEFESNFSQNAETLTAKADLTALMAKDEAAYETAREFIEKALSLEPDNIDANNIAAMIMVHQYGRGFGGTAADMKKSREYAAKVLRHDSQIPLANYSYALSHKDVRNPPDNALNAASYALDYYRDKGFIGPNLGLATILLKGEKYNEALVPINRAITWGNDPNMRISAKSMKKYIEAERAR